MELVDLIVAIVVVTILVTVVVGLATYVAYKLRLARQPGRSGGDEEEGTRYFFLHEPPEEGPGDGPTAAEVDDAAVADRGTGGDRSGGGPAGGDTPSGDGR